MNLPKHLGLLGITAFANAAAAAEEGPLETMVVTGTRSPQTLEDVAVRTEIIDRRQIETTNSNTLADAVEWTNGVRIENNCQNCNFPQIRLLGLTGGYTQILTDGRPNMSSLAAVYGLEQIPVALIDRIEVVKGGASALYGPGAVAGVVNIIPRTPVLNGGYLRQEYATFGHGPNFTTEGAYDWVHASGKAGATVYGQSFTVSPYDRDGDRFSEVARRDAWSAGIRAFAEPLEDARLTLDYTYLNEDRRGGDHINKPIRLTNITEWIDSTQHLLGARWSHQVRDDFRYELTGSANLTERDTYYGTGGDPNAYGHSESNLTFLDALGHYRLHPALTASFGYQWQYEKTEDSQPAYQRETEQSIRNHGLLTQLEWEPGTRWSILAGSRLDFNSAVDDPILSPRLAAKYSPNDDWDIRGAWSTGFRAPQVFEEDLHVGSAGGEATVIRNGANLKEESSQTFSLGAQWHPELNEQRPFNLEVNVFLTRLEDSFDIVETDNPATPETEFERINSGGAKVYGAEINFAWNITERVLFEIGMVEQRSRYNDAAGDFGSRNFDRTPERYGVAQLTWQNDLADLFVGAKYTGPMEVPHYAGSAGEDRLERSPSMVTVDLGLRKTLDWGNTRFILSTGVKNVFDEFQKDLDQGPDRDSNYVYGPRFPRTYHVSAKWEF